MPGLGVAALVAGYAAWYTLFQKVWGNGGSYLYWLTGSGKFSGPVNPTGGGGKQVKLPDGTTITANEPNPGAGAGPRGAGATPIH